MRVKRILPNVVLSAALLGTTGGVCQQPMAEAAIVTGAEAPEPGTIGNRAAPEIITLQEPAIKGLIAIDEQMDPFDLEASSRQSVSLRSALQTAVQQNLDIGIAHTQELRQHWNYVSSLGKFLPDINGGYSLFGIAGALLLPFSTGSSGSSSKISLPSHFNVLNAGFSYYGYQGGKAVFGALQNLHLSRAQSAQSRFTLSDTLLQVTSGYYNLLLNEALLEVRLRAVDTSMEQLRMNTELSNNGLATNLDVLQAETQLSRDRQQLINQQIARRSAAIQLATILNTNPAADIVPTDRSLRKVRLLSQSLKVNDLLTTAITHRPELKQNEELRLAARNAVVVAAAPLQPTVRMSGNVFGFGTDPSNSSTLYTLALNANWTLHGLGVTDGGATQAARFLVRQRQLQSSQTLAKVINEVRNSLLKSLQAERQITETGNEVASAKEELRLARIRLQHGLGNNIDVITAQRDLTSALVNRVQSIIDFNTAQAQLLHDIGAISVDRLTSSTPLERSY